MTRLHLARWLLGVGVALASPAFAQDAFEIQVYDSTTADPGTAGLEVHLNHFFDGTTTPSPQGEVPTEHLTHLTFVGGLGVTRWWELGCYLQTVLRPDGHWDSGGFKFRTKFRWPEQLGPVGLALNIEVSRVSKLYEADGWGSELRPIVDARWGPLYVSFNPIIDIPLAGSDAWKPEFQPAEKVSVDLNKTWALGAEFYSNFGQIGHPLPGSEQVHRLFGAVDISTRYLSINLGVGYGLSGPEKWIVKAIVGIHPPEPEK